MPATRVLPTEEATALLELAREIADARAAADGHRGRGHRDLPARGVPHPRPRRAARAALPGGVRRRRPALRGLPPGGRGDRHRLGERRRRCLGARAVLLRARHQGHRGAATGVAARHARRRAARRLLPLRGARRLRPLGDEDPRPARRRRLRHQRRQGLDHARRPRRLLQGDGPDVRRAQRHLLLPGARRHRGAERRPARAEDGPHRLGDGDDAVRRRPRPRRPAARRGGRRPQDRPRRPRLRAARHRRRGRRARPGGRSTTRSPTPRNASSSAGRSSTSRASASCSPTWRPACRAPGR